MAPEIQAEGSGAEVRLVPAASPVHVEDGSFEVPVMVNGVDHHFVDRGEASDGLGVFQFALHFNPDVITVEEMQPGSFLGSTGRVTSCFSEIRPEDRSIFDFGCVSTSPPESGPQGSGSLARLILVPVAAGSSDLVLEGEMGGPLGSTGDDIPLKAMGASVTVAGSPGSFSVDLATPSPSQPHLVTSSATATSGGNASSSPTPRVAGLSGAGGGPQTRQALPRELVLAGSLAAVGALAVLAGALYRLTPMTYFARSLGPLQRAIRSRSARSHRERR